MAKRRMIEIKNIEDFNVFLFKWLEPGPGADRAFAIVGGTLVENCLEAYLKSRMVDKKLTDGRTVFTNLFDGVGPLNAFSAKTNVAFSAGLVGPMVFTDMEAIREIRNKFAHTVFSAEKKSFPVLLNFDSSEIATLIGKLTPIENMNFVLNLGESAQITTAKDNKERFGSAVATVATTLWLATENKTGEINKVILS